MDSFSKVSIDDKDYDEEEVHEIKPRIPNEVVSNIISYR